MLLNRDKSVNGTNRNILPTVTSKLMLDLINTFRLNAVQRNTEWHETFTKYEVGKRNAQMDKMVEKECVQANVELKTLRQKRLKEQYAQDWAQWEQELNGLGLAILKDRL